MTRSSCSFPDSGCDPWRNLHRFFVYGIFLAAMMLSGCGKVSLPIIGKEKKVKPVISINLICSGDCNDSRSVRVAVYVLTEANRFGSLSPLAVFGSESESTRDELGVGEGAFHIESVSPGDSVLVRFDLSSMDSRISELSIGVMAHFADVTPEKTDRYLVRVVDLVMPANINIQLLAGSLKGSATVKK